MYKLAVKNAFLFIGAMIGAGFATGAELMVFFKDANIFTVLISAMIIAGFSCVFVLFGRTMAKYRRVNMVVDVIMFACAIITVVTMQAGIEELFGDNYGIWGIGLLSAIAVAIVCRYSLNVTKIMNLIIVPIIVTMMIILAIVARPQLAIVGTFLPMKALSYAAMNLMLGGYLIAKDSVGMRTKHSLLMAIIIFIVVAIMMFVMLCVSKLSPNSAMPMYRVAIQEGLGGVACAIIYFAIITTLIGAGKVVASGLNDVMHGKWAGSIMLILLAVVCHGAKFEYMVNTFYPITGYVGIGICMTILALLLHNKLKNITSKKIKHVAY